MLVASEMSSVVVDTLYWTVQLRIVLIHRKIVRNAGEKLWTVFNGVLIQTQTQKLPRLRSITLLSPPAAKMKILSEETGETSWTSSWPAWGMPLALAMFGDSLTLPMTVEEEPS